MLFQIQNFSTLKSMNLEDLNSIVPV